MTNKGSILNDYDAVLEAASKSNSIREALESLGLRAAGGNYAAFKTSCERFQISVPCYDYSSQPRNPGRPFKKSIPNEDVFIE